MLTKILSNTWLPATTIISSKIFGLLLCNALLTTPFKITSVPGNSIFSIRPLYENPDNIVFVTTYSNIIMMGIFWIVLIFKVSQYKLFNSKTISPKTVIKLAENDLIGIVKSDDALYTQTLIWIIFSWIGMIFVALTTFYYNLTPIFHFAIGIGVNIAISLYFAINARKI
jgi:hypothetical protein